MIRGANRVSSEARARAFLPERLPAVALRRRLAALWSPAWPARRSISARTESDSTDRGRGCRGGGRV